MDGICNSLNGIAKISAIRFLHYLACSNGGKAVPSLKLNQLRQ
jgi:hypothetical protein